MASATLTSFARDHLGSGTDARFADGNRPGALTMTVPREYVHRAAVSEVFLTDWRRGRSGSWLVSAQWPRAHSLYRPVNGLHDPLLLIETVRQAGILLSHVVHGVPLDHPIVWRKLRYDLSPTALRATDAPADVQLHITDRDVVRRGRQLAGVRQEFRIVCDGSDLASAMLDYSCHSPAVYRRLRGEYGDLVLANSRKLPVPEPVSPHLVGRDRTGDVVLSPADGAGRWQLRVDTSHPVLFDHPVDHVPGMLMIEAVRQAARALTPGGALPVTLECAFERFAEMDAPCWVTARTTGRSGGGCREVEVGIEQHGRRVLAARVGGLPMP
ncbi:adhesin [Streptomyces albospinus]|uniref:Adhesin n=1 Tax=Streptomyces albospinus TaxID=285515 RepID=A0ABQ2UPG8_9ACTN|nr:ScbA/BarX family gamma-butyrolactone biosynthesis protein [Streptomyces albospinus]GGU47508.1 adhesin [Streptomyces albospinus]